jgi:hypothetical protein
LKKKHIILICIFIITNIFLCGCNGNSAEYNKFYGNWERIEQDGSIVQFNFFKGNTYELIDDDTYLQGNFTVEENNRLIIFLDKIPWENNYFFSDDNTKLTLTYTLTDADNTSVTYTKIL